MLVEKWTGNAEMLNKVRLHRASLMHTKNFYEAYSHDKFDDSRHSNAHSDLHDAGFPRLNA
ncbi:hypothetical protein DX994_28630 [Klebsiella pneumoniae]|nr:hypothetical protein DX994_28630 [Klebsiella pneumoniae]